MRFYQIKSTEKGAQPPRWYRVLVPSGITFSQLYVLLCYAHGDALCKASLYWYSTKNHVILIEEFIDGEPDFTDSIGDIFDAKGTYIDTFFKKGFKISLYTGISFDLSIEVESEAEEFPELRAPKVIKTSRAIANELGGQFGEDILPEELFAVVRTTEQVFRSAEELRNDLGCKTIMHAAENPVTPEESIFRGKISKAADKFNVIFQSLYDDEELCPLLKQMQHYLDLEPEQAEDKKPLHDLMRKIDNIMLRKWGQRFGNYALASSFGDLVDGMVEVPDLNAKPKRPHIKTEDYINIYTKEELLFIADEYDLKLPSNKSKRNLAKAVLQQMFSPESIKNRLIQLEDDEMEVFRLTAECEYGRFSESDEEEAAGEELIDELLAAALQDGRLFVTDLVRNVYEELDKEELETERQKTIWMKKCLEIARSFYGVLGWDVLGKLFARKFKGVDADELKSIYRRIPSIYHDFEEIGGKLVLNYYLHDNYYRYLEERVQRDKPFYIPSRKEIDEFYDKGCLLSSSTHQAMYRFLISRIGFEPKAAELEVMEIYHQINNGARMQTVIDNLNPDGSGDFVFSSEKDVKDFAQLYMDMNNRSHLRDNRGYTPNDLFHVMGGTKGMPEDMIISPRGPEAARLLDEAREELAKRGVSLDELRIQSMLKDEGAGQEEGILKGGDMLLSEGMLRGEKRKKIGRNEPCPCGSGKKYKNCCGK